MGALQEFVRDAPAWVFAFMAGLPALLTVAVAAAGLWSRRNARTLAAMTDTTIDALSPGYRLASGTAVAEGRLKAPLTGRACVWAAAVTDRVTVTGTGNDRTTSWSRHSETETARPILVEWNGVRARIEPRGATVYHGAWSEWYGPSADARGSEPALHPGDVAMSGARVEVMSDPDRKFRFRERYLFADAPLFVLGAVAGPGRDGLFTIRAEPGRPFLISARSPADIEAESRLALSGALIAAALFAAVTAGVLMLRFG